ncbi:MAG: flagellar basal body rod protein FlgC [Spirochaetes bacterium GWF1_51_8]|nr:MAG: flagellar basal body rod protein FlgC [Spirochaetes bacterium GWF1_51_8]
MGTFGVLNIAGSGLTAQRLQIDVIANNIANANSVTTADGGPYQRQVVVMAPIDDSLTFKSHLLPDALKKEVGKGVKVTQIKKDEKPPRMVYDPTHPYALQSGQWKGYVAYPNVNIVEEMTNMISANRAYEANVNLVNSARQMFEKALMLGR